MITRRFAIVSAALSLPSLGLVLPMHEASAQSASSSASDYKVGDKLKPQGSEAGGAADQAFKRTEWDALMPKNWDPMKGFSVLKFGSLQDGDPKAMQALADLKRSWENAPAEPAMDNARIRIAGFAVPLDMEGKSVREFLLVPYFGACIHTPPPPANQIIHVTMAQPAKGIRMMDAVWVSGQLHLAVSESSFGTATYRMDGQQAEPYAER